MLDSATINVGKVSPSGVVEYLQYTLSSVFINSFTTANVSGSGVLPEDTVQLSFAKVSELYTLGTPNTAG